jgi:hypothetical protein
VFGAMLAEGTHSPLLRADFLFQLPVELLQEKFIALANRAGGSEANGCDRREVCLHGLGKVLPQLARVEHKPITRWR